MGGGSPGRARAEAERGDVAEGLRWVGGRDEDGVGAGLLRQALGEGDPGHSLPTNFSARARSESSACDQNTSGPRDL